MKGYRRHEHVLPRMTAPGYFEAVAKAAAWEAAAAPWLLIRLPDEHFVWVACWRSPFMRRQTERFNALRRERRERHLASILAPKLTF